MRTSTSIRSHSACQAYVSLTVALVVAVLVTLMMVP